jgi:excisionase family DNA binding protein
MSESQVALPIPDEVLDALAERIAGIVVERITDSLLPPSKRWMRTQDAAEYLGLTRSTLYSRIGDIPHHKIDRLLLFKRDDLDQWLEGHRHEPSSTRLRPQLPPQPVRRAPRQRQAPATDLLPIGPKPKASSQRPKRERPLPAPLSGSEEDKERWARELEISRPALDAMGPKEFTAAWDHRNQRLHDGGVFEHISKLYDHYGAQAVERMSPTELIQATQDLPTGKAAL